MQFSFHARKVLFALTYFVGQSLSSYSQLPNMAPGAPGGLPSKEGRVFIEEVVTVSDSAKKNKIYAAVKDWISKTFKDSKSVIDYEDREEGKIVCKGFYQGQRANNDRLNLRFTMDFTVKDSKYRVQLHNLDVQEEHFSPLGTGLNPYYPLSKVDIDRMNQEYIDKTAKPRYKRKYSEEMLMKTTLPLVAIYQSAKTTIEKTLKGQASNDF